MPAKRNKRKSNGASLPYPKPEPDSEDKNVIVRPLGSSTSLEKFFSQYTKFQYLLLNSPVAEFKRLCEEYGWENDDNEKKDARHEFNVAIKKEFGDLYGSDEKDINNWHKLCHVLRIDPVPDTLKECRCAVLTKHVNLVDLVQGDKMEVQIFETERDLSKYTKRTKKFFPKEDAVDGGVLRALRRRIFSPRGPAFKGDLDEPDSNSIADLF